jgi:outer membrane protein
VDLHSRCIPVATVNLSKAVIMRRIIPAVAFTGACALGGLAHAQSVPQSAPQPAPAASPAASQSGALAGTILLRVRAIGIIPQTTSSSISVIGGGVNATSSAAPEIDLSYFFTDHIAIEGIAATTHHYISAGNTAIGHVDLGSVWVLPPTVTLQYHFMPESRFSPYLGVGLTAGFFYDSKPNGPTITKVGYSDALGPAIQAGIDYHIAGPWSANLDVKQIFLNTDARINGGAIVAKTALDPTVVGAGIGYRF